MAFPEDAKTSPQVDWYSPVALSDPDVTLLDPETPTERKRRRAKLFLKHAAVLFLSSFLLLQVLKLGLGVFKKSCHGGKYHHDEFEYFKHEPELFASSYPPHDRPHPEHCSAWSKSASVENSTFNYTFPIDSSFLRLVARGPFDGTVEYVLADAGLEESDTSVLGVQVALSWKGSHGPEPKSDRSLLRFAQRGHHAHARIHAHVCELKRHDGELLGVGIFAHPRHRRHHDHPHPPHHRDGAPPSYVGGHNTLPFPFPTRGGRFPPPPPPPRGRHPHGPSHPPFPPHHGDHKHHFSPIHAKVVVTLPRGAVHIAALESIFPGLKHSIRAGVFDDVTFGAIGVVGRAIDLDTLTAGRAGLISGHNSPVNGTFVVYDKLSIITSNASVTADVTLLAGDKQERPTTLDIKTSNATIRTAVNLGLKDDSYAAIASNGSYSISLITSNAPIVAVIPEAPITSTVKSSFITSHGAINATLPSTFEGGFSLISGRGGQGHVGVNEDTKDPTGLDRKRVVSVKSIFGGIVNGHVGWKSTDEDAVETEEEGLVGGWEMVDLAEKVEDADEIWTHESEMVDRKLSSHVTLLTSEGDNTLYFA